jgi:hypothetical protein
MSSKKAEWVQPWKQPTWQRRFLTFIFWEGILFTPLAVSIAYQQTPGIWKLIAAALPVAWAVLNIAQRYGQSTSANASAKANPTTERIRAMEAGEHGAEKFLMRPVKAMIVTPETSGHPEDYTAFCREFGLAAPATGWGLVCCEDDKGQHWTGLAANVGRIREFEAKTPADDTGLNLSECGIHEFRPGWPEEWDLDHDSHAERT